MDYYGLPQAHLTIHREPTTFDEATACPERAKWEGAMGREMQSLKDNEVWELTSLPPGKGAIGCKWVYKVKTNSDGSLEHYKARLVARGFDQRYGLDYDETFCPVVRLESLKTLIALSTQQGLELHHVDVHTAFLNGTLQEEVYTKQPIGYEKEGKEHLVCRLKKSIYGLKQSSRCWNTALDSHLKRMGFSQSKSDPCIYISRRRHLLHRSLRGRHDSGWEGQKPDEVCQGRTVIKVRHQGPRQTALLPGHVHCPEPGGKGDLDGATHIHSETPDQDRDERQQTCQDPSGSWTPTRESERGRGSSRSAVIPVSGRKSDVSSHVYETRHCLCCGNVGKVLQQAQPKSLDCCETCVVNFGILYRGESGVLGYSDADWAGDADDRKSTSGYMFLIAGGPVSWKSRKQSTVALSTAEAEYVALSTAVQECMWMQRLLSELGNPPDGPTTILEDNQSSIAMAKNPQFHGRAKHIDIKHHFIRDQVSIGSIELQYCPTNEMLARRLDKGTCS